MALNLKYFHIPNLSPDLPRNTIDISHVIKLPASIPKTELQQNMDKFCKLLERIMKARENESPMSDDEDEYSQRRKDVEKDLKCVTIGIEKNRAVELVSKKQQIKKGKVRATILNSSKIIVLCLPNTKQKTSMMRKSKPELLFTG